MGITDINDLRSIFTVATFAVFIAIVWWAWSGRRGEEFRAAALLPLDDDTELLPPRGGGVGERGLKTPPSSRPSPIEGEGVSRLRKI